MKELESHCFASITPFVSDLQTTWGDQEVISTKDIIRICSTFGIFYFPIPLKSDESGNRREK